MKFGSKQKRQILKRKTIDLILLAIIINLNKNAEQIGKVKHIIIEHTGMTNLVSLLRYLPLVDEIHVDAYALKVVF